MKSSVVDTSWEGSGNVSSSRDLGPCESSEHGVECEVEPQVSVSGI